MSIVQGGPGFPFFHRHVYLYLCTDMWSPVSVPLQSIPDVEIRCTIDKVKVVSVALLLLILLPLLLDQ